MSLSPAVHEPTEPANPLSDLLARCVVSVADGEGAFRGTGFFVAPGEVLTCAHVVHGVETVIVGWDMGSCSAAVAKILPDLDHGDRAASFYPLPDVVLLRLADPPEGHPCVALAAEPVAGPQADVLRLSAFTVGEHAAGLLSRSSAATSYEGPFEEDGHRLLKLAAGRIVGGFSGAPLLNVRSGGVCGIVESSRGERAPHGGFGVPVRAFVAALPGLTKRSAAFHRTDARWGDAVRDERVRTAECAGTHNRIPLREPLIELEPGAKVAASDLLRPRRAVVPLVGRERLLDELMLWRESDPRLRVAILAGAGGFGKTRLAAELCAAAQLAGWRAGLLDPEPPGEGALDAIADWPGRLLIAIDYAETRPEVVSELLLALRRRTCRPPARVILVVRQGTGTDELRRMFNAHALEELTDILRPAEIVRLDRELDRLELLDVARRAFAAQRGRIMPTPGRAPSLRADHFERPLFVLAAALLAIDDAAIDVDALSIDELLGRVLDEHEAAYWEGWDERLGVGLHADDRRCAVALATLLGADGEDDAATVVRLVPGLADASGERVRSVALAEPSLRLRPAGRPSGDPPARAGPSGRGAGGRRCRGAAAAARRRAGRGLGNAAPARAARAQPSAESGSRGSRHGCTRRARRAPGGTRRQVARHRQRRARGVAAAGHRGIAPAGGRDRSESVAHRPSPRPPRARDRDRRPSPSTASASLPKAILATSPTSPHHSTASQSTSATLAATTTR